MSHIKEFKVNNYLTLKLKQVVGTYELETIIYVAGERFRQCKFLLLDIPINEISSFDEIDSIDEAVTKLDRSQERNKLYERKIPFEVEFWGHCSNLQVWAEYNYDTRLLHSNLAFPLLKRLTEVGDPVANRVFREEIVKRFLSGSRNVQEFLIVEGYIQILSMVEREVLFRAESSNFASLESHVGHRIEVVPNCKSHFGVLLRDGNITGLHLLAENVKKRNKKLFPYQIKHFMNLKTLNLSHFMMLTIPRWVQNLVNLKTLKLSLNHLIAIPENVGKLENLELLDLSLNSLSEIPKEIEYLKNLKVLQLSYNQFTEFPKEALRLDKLESLDLSHNQIKVIPPKIGEMCSLKSLGLSDNPVSSLPDELLDLTNVEKVFIGGTKIKKDEEFTKELKKRKIKIFPSGLLEFETYY